MARKPKAPLYEKAWKRKPKDTIEEKELGYGRLHDYKNHRDVHMFWDLGPEAKEDQIFMLKIDGKEYLFNAEEMNKYIRWV